MDLFFLGFGSVDSNLWLRGPTIVGANEGSVSTVWSAEGKRPEFVGAKRAASLLQRRAATIERTEHMVRVLLIPPKRKRPSERIGLFVFDTVSDRRFFQRYIICLYITYANTANTMARNTKKTLRSFLPEFHTWYENHSDPRQAAIRNKLGA